MVNHLGGIDDARFDQVFVAVGGRVVAEVAFALDHLVDHDAALDASIGGDLTQRRAQHVAHELDAVVAVITEAEVVQPVAGP